MAFNSNEFIKNNLLKSLKNGGFDSGQVMIFAFNYLKKGLINQDTFDEIQQAVSDYETEKAQPEQAPEQAPEKAPEQEATE